MTGRRGRGEGSVEKQPDGHWRAWCSLGTAGGKRRRPTKTFGSKREALDWLATQRAVAGRVGAQVMTLGDWLAEWLSQKKGKVETATWVYYEVRCRRRITPHLGTMRLADLAVRDVEAFLVTLREAGTSGTEQRCCLKTLRAALAGAVEQGLVLANVAKKVKPPLGSPRPIHPFTEAEAKQFLAAARGQRLEALWDFALDAGARPGEWLALSWPDIDWASSQVYIHRSLSWAGGEADVKATKTAAGRRRVLLARRTLEALSAHRARMRGEGREVEGGLVFPSAKGTFLRPSFLRRRLFLPAVRAAGIAGRHQLYDLRHTNATLLLARGVNVKVLSQRLGHSRIEVTLRHYAHCLPGMQEAAALAVDALLGEWHASGTAGPRAPGVT